MQDAFRKKPEAVGIIEKEQKADLVGNVYDIEHMRQLVEDTLAELNEFLTWLRSAVGAEKENA